MGQYIEGLTKIPQPIPAEKIREQRELEEKQRAMERKIRAVSYTHLINIQNKLQTMIDEI